MAAVNLPMPTWSMRKSALLGIVTMRDLLFSENSSKLSEVR